LAATFAAVTTTAVTTTTVIGPPAADPLLLPVRTAAPKIGFRAQYLQLLRRGEFPGIKIGNKWYVRAEDLEAFVRGDLDGPVLPNVTPAA
jgi:hypothetical protein